MSLLRLKRGLESFFAPHRHAEELIDATFDESRGERELLDAERDWLDAHLASCPRCRNVEASRRDLFDALRLMKREAAPVGFAGRVLLAARARGRSDDAVREVSTDHRFVLGWRGSLVPASQRAVGVLLIVAVLGTLSAVVAVRSKTDPYVKQGTGEPLTGGTRLGQIESPDFVVRAPGLGAARARAQFTAIVNSHGGVFSDAGDAIIARIPRDRLLSMTQDLAERGRYKMSKSDRGDLSSSLDPIVVRFELE